MFKNIAFVCLLSTSLFSLPSIAMEVPGEAPYGCQRAPASLLPFDEDTLERVAEFRHTIEQLQTHTGRKTFGYDDEETLDLNGAEDAEMIYWKAVKDYKDASRYDLPKQQRDEARAPECAKMIQQGSTSSRLWIEAGCQHANPDFFFRGVSILASLCTNNSEEDLKTLACTQALYRVGEHYFPEAATPGHRNASPYILQRKKSRFVLARLMIC